MAADDFFNRWSRRKLQAPDAPLSEDAGTRPVAEPPPDAAAPRTLPTMEDVTKLTGDSDFSSFVASGVDPDVRNSAMKKLFALPNFNVMDGLDIYIDDYSKPDPLPPGMLASLRHAKDLLDPLALLEKPVMRMLESAPEAAAASPTAVAPVPDSESRETQAGTCDEMPAEAAATETATPETPVADESNLIGMEKADAIMTPGGTGSNDHTVQSM